ncbi:GIY-YIG nuclease family protein [Bradyrhizobium sp. LA6.8]|uniref:GIY-YIG nuclease family protein n=1 Tax=unclassified Bradyrhizobium TaxID=2631580 RepID=UPI003397E7C1
MTTFLYAIGRRCGPVKIGISANPKGRLAEFQTACPFKIHLLHFALCESRASAFEDEASAHRFLREHRLWGEWFNVDWTVAHDVVSTAVLAGNHFRERLRRGE